MRAKTIYVRLSDAGERLDAFLAKKAGVTRSQIQKLIEHGDVLVNGKPLSQNYKVRADDEINIKFPEKSVEGLIPEAIPVEILFKDKYLIVVNKPAGMVVYPSAGHSHGTLMNAIAYQCKKLASIGGPLRPGVVQRLDKDTSGVMVIAIDDRAYYNLVEEFRQRTINRKYKALVYGKLKNDTGEIKGLIGRSDTDRKKMSTRVKRGKEAVTKWNVVRRFNDATLIDVKLDTGRTHQIRVHFASIGHPVIGDRTYGRKTEVEIDKRKIPVPRQMLHAEVLGFNHPVTGEHMEFSSTLPEDMREALDLYETSH